MVLESKDFEYLVVFRVTTFGVRFINDYKFILILNQPSLIGTFPSDMLEEKERQGESQPRWSVIQIPSLYGKVFVFFKDGSMQPMF